MKLGFKLFIYIILFFFSYLESSWFIFFPKENFRFLCGICFFLEIVIFKFKFKIRIKFPVSFLFILSFMSMILLPIQNLKMGDGILLLNYFNLETFYFGYHLTLDEILEAFFHSVFYKLFFLNELEVSNPMLIYRIFSTILGGILLFQIYQFVKKRFFKFSTSILILTSGGISLFYGYSENYSIITFLIWNYIFYSINILDQEKKGFNYLNKICILASLMILTHLVSGYLIFSLIYLCYVLSDKKTFLKNSIYSFLLCSIIILPIIFYFMFFSSVRFDFLQTHLTNPKFYPIKDILSIEHFKNIFFTIIGSSFLGFIIFIYSIIFHFEEIKKLIYDKKIQFLLFILLGFLIHGFFHYPQLGFPADWDLLAFFWTPILFLAIFIYEKLELDFNSFFVFVIILFSLNTYYNSKINISELEKLDSSILHLNEFIKTEKIDFSNVKPEHKKFYLKTIYFLYESKQKIQSIDKTNSLIKENDSFHDELIRREYKFDKVWQKDFYKRLTKFHLNYLEFLNKK